MTCWQHEGCVLWLRGRACCGLPVVSGTTCCTRVRWWWVSGLCKMSHIDKGHTILYTSHYSNNKQSGLQWYIGCNIILEWWAQCTKILFMFLRDLISMRVQTNLYGQNDDTSPHSLYHEDLCLDSWCFRDSIAKYSSFSPHLGFKTKLEKSI